MKSDEIIRHYVHHDEPAPPDGWKRLLWMAAQLVRRAQHERRTYRPLREMRGEQGKGGDQDGVQERRQVLRQEELWREKRKVSE